MVPKYNSKAASVIGNPLYMDEATAKGERLSYARCFIEIKASDKLPKTVKLALSKEEFLEIPVDFEWVSPICSKCNSFGHIDSQCPIVIIEKWIPKHSSNSSHSTVQDISNHTGAPDSSSSQSQAKFATITKSGNDNTTTIISGKEYSNSELEVPDKHVEHHVSLSNVSAANSGYSEGAQAKEINSADEYEILVDIESSLVGEPDKGYHSAKIFE